MDKKQVVKSLLGDKKLSAKEKLGPSAALFIIFITGILFLRPAVSSIVSNNKKLLASKEELSHLQAKKSALKSYQTQDREVILDQQLKLISRYIPSSKPSLQALVSLVSLSRNQSLQFSGITLNPGSIKSSRSGTTSVTRKAEGDTSSTQSLDSFDITFSVIGTKQDLESFVIKLKELAPMMRIDKFTTSFINKDENNKPVLNSENLLLNVQLNLKIYYQRVPDKLPAFEQPLPLLTKEEEKMLEDLTGYVFATNEIPTVESLGQGGELGNKSPFKKLEQTQPDPRTPAR